MPPSFTAESLRRALAINSPKLVKELYEITLRRIAYETGRQQRLDSKATSLLTASGISVTLAFTFTAAISSSQGAVLFHSVFNYLLTAFGIALLLGFAAAGFAAWSLLIRKQYPAPSDHVIFDADHLKMANDIEPGGNDTEAQAEEWRLMAYQKTIIEHFWTIAERQETLHENKARRIQAGQMAFVGFLLLLLVVCGLIGLAVYSAHDVTQAAARSAAAAKGSAQGPPRDP